MRLLLLANPAASGRVRRLLPSLREWFARRVDSFDAAETASAEELRRQARSAAQAGYDAVVAVGGDGTAHNVLNALTGTDAALGILPLGHGNDMARSLGVPLRPLAAAEALTRAPIASIDVVRAGERAYACVAGVGFDAAVNERANTWGDWPRGHARYLLAGLRTLATFRPPRLQLVTDSEEFAGDAMWVAVANSPCYGGGVRIAPEAAMDDGVLDVCIIESVSGLELLKLYPALLAGEHLRSPRVRYFRSCWVEFRAPAEAPVYGDGEFLGRLPLRLTIEPGALRVLRPGR